jgi:hypothetical protein
MRMRSTRAAILGAGASVGMVLGMLLRSSYADVTPGTVSSVEGVWGFVSETNTETGQTLHTDRDLKAIWIFSKKYYCLARMDVNRTARSKAELQKAPPDEQVKYYEQLLQYASTAGTYSVSGDTLTRNWDISLGPDIIGQKQMAHFSSDREHLTVDLPRRSPTSGPASRVVYRRLE